jgi:SagB-type dehydrogenase family enzyme
MKADRIVPEPHYEEFVSELFHENSKQHRSDARFIERILAANFDPGVQTLMAPTHKRYGRDVKRTVLPTSFPKSKLPFDEAVLTRRSEREFGKVPLSFAEVAKLLHHTYGVTGVLEAGAHKTLLRAAPSGGALYPIEIYLLARNVRRLGVGIYHFSPAGNYIEQISADDPFPELIRATYARELEDAAIVLAMTGVSIKNRVKYGERGYRFMLIEAGHSAQNFLLTATAMGLRSFTLGGFVDDELDALLRVDGFEETTLYLMAAGKPARR